MTTQTSPFSISLDAAISAAIGDAMKSGDAVILPFPTLYLWTQNGHASYKASGGALYHGGFATKAENVVEVTGQTLASIPAGFTAIDISTRDGGEFPAYVTRQIAVAPVGRRESWISKDGRRHASYIEGGRRHLQVLCYMAEADQETKTYQEWGAVVLTAKGYQATNLAKAFREWDKASANLRSEIAPGVPSTAFFLPIGTFGKERVVVQVGQPGAQSPITPIGPHIPDPLTTDVLVTRFVGQEVAERMAEMRVQAQEWLEAWSKTQMNTEEAATDHGNADPYGFGEVPF